MRFRKKYRDRICHCTRCRKQMMSSNRIVRHGRYVCVACNAQMDKNLGAEFAKRAKPPRFHTEEEQHRKAQQTAAIELALRIAAYFTYGVIPDREIVTKEPSVRALIESRRSQTSRMYRRLRYDIDHIKDILTKMEMRGDFKQC
jgi:hypothetical protein